MFTFLDEFDTRRKPTANFLVLKKKKSVALFLRGSSLVRLLVHTIRPEPNEPIKSSPSHWNYQDGRLRARVAVLLRIGKHRSEMPDASLPSIGRSVAAHVLVKFSWNIILTKKSEAETRPSVFLPHLI